MKWIDNKYILTDNSRIELVEGELHFHFKDTIIMCPKSYTKECNELLSAWSYTYIYEFDESKQDQYLFNAWKYLFFKNVLSHENVKELIEDLYPTDKPV